SEPADGDGVDDAGSDADTTGSADSSLDEAVRVESPPADGADAGTVLDIPGLDESGIDLADLQAGADKLDAADEDDVVILSLPTGEPVDGGDLQPLTATIRGDNVFLEGTAPSVEVALAYEEQARVIWGDQVVPRYSIDERAPDPQADDVKLEKPVLFEPGSSTIDPEYLPVLDACFEFLTAFPEVTMIVEGHTDDVGSEEYNLRLAEERAEAIVSYYESLGLDRDRLVTVAAGEASPLADNGTEEGREQNRRIDLSLVGALLDATNGVDANGVDADDETDDPTGSDDS
ncbi:MAG: OmpA family protein, partial [Actinomycetota bacterium]